MSFPSPGNSGQQPNQPYLQAGQPYPQQPGQPPYPQPAQAYPQGQPYSLRTQPYPQPSYSKPAQPYSGGTPYGPQRLQPYPPMQPGSGPPQVARPKAMDTAVILMRIGAVMSLSEVVEGVLTIRATQHDFDGLRNSKLATDGWGPFIDGVLGTLAVFYVIACLLDAGLWIWMSVMNGKGKSWARIVATVFFGLGVLVMLNHMLGSGDIVAKLVHVATIVVGAVAIFLMYRPESNQYYEQMSRPRIAYLAW